MPTFLVLNSASPQFTNSNHDREGALEKPGCLKLAERKKLSRSGRDIYKRAKPTRSPAKAFSEPKPGHLLGFTPTLLGCPKMCPKILRTATYEVQLIASSTSFESKLLS